MSTDLLALESHRRRLLVLAVNVDQELAGIERAIRVWRVSPGRPRKPYTMTPDEARAMHVRFNAGERDENVRRGNAEYQRRWRRRQRAAA